MITARAVMPGKFWIVEKEGIRKGTMAASPDGSINTLIDGQNRTYSSWDAAVKELDLSDKPERKQVEVPHEVEGYPTNCTPFNSVWDVKKKLPLFTKSEKSRSLHAAGYYYLGAHFFTKAQDALVRAKQQGRLYRDLQGYTTQNSNNHIGCGPGATSSLGNHYFQNTSQPDLYQHALMQNHLPLARSLSLSMDDLLRRIVMQLLTCQFELSIQALELSYPIRFQHYFAKELVQLQEMVRRGWVSIEPEQLQVLPKGELFICQICAIFDRYRDSP